MEKGNPAPSSVPMHEQEKQGGKCCGGCCDYRRAVIVLCIISLVFSIIGIINPALGTVGSGEYPELEQIAKDHSTNLLIMGIVHIVMTIVALVGAIIFNFFMVALYVLWSILYLIISIILEKQMVDELLAWIETEAGTDSTWSASDQDELESVINTYMIITYVITALFTALWVYPSVFLSVEIKKGIMTKETYPREEMSCCCVAHRN